MPYTHLALEYPAAAQRMSLVRIDRRGLTVRVSDDAGLPPLGLPRQARLLSIDDVLCELRMVARVIARPQQGALQVTMQPSRADDHASLWLALRAHQMRGGTLFEGAGLALLSTIDRALAAEAERFDAGAHCDVAFTLPGLADARFFAVWLEYHFAEIVARAHTASSPAELCEMRLRSIDSNVLEVRFSYAWANCSAPACSEEISAWIAAEADRLFGLMVEPSLPYKAQPAALTRLPRNNVFTHSDDAPV
ncbi:hypothetical protein D7S89_24710 [Trinickia fusca]|uniref:Uncharacterized protein n=2 Tax=Trinickia fusca TaxID=2419777 RepID=A0A494X0M4_9BURK|nr:hypothetical protein D7S89_24710 [Trinickia fusca]